MVMVNLADRVGFEPTAPFGTFDFKSNALNLTQPSIRKFLEGAVGFKPTEPMKVLPISNRIL